MTDLIELSEMLASLPGNIEPLSREQLGAVVTAFIEWKGNTVNEDEKTALSDARSILRRLEKHMAGLPIKALASFIDGAEISERHVNEALIAIDYVMPGEPS